jgi:hypothetical protein
MRYTKANTGTYQTAMANTYQTLINLSDTAKIDRFGGQVAVGDLVASGDLELRTGQWVTLGAGVNGQFVFTRNGIVYVSWAGKGDGFHGRTSRFVRAVDWHKPNRK